MNLVELASRGLRCSLTPDGITQAKQQLQTRQKYKWCNLNSFPLGKVLELGLQDSIINLKSGTGKSHTKAKLVRELKPELAYLLGAMRDGSFITTQGKHWVRVYDSIDSTWLGKTIIPLFSKIFEVSMKLRITEHEKYADVSNKPLFYQLKTYMATPHKNVPKVVQDSSPDVIKSYIRGFFDAEGYVSKKPIHTIKITQKNRESLDFLKQFLETSGIPCGKICQHILPIYGKENVGKFSADIGSFHPAKIIKLRKLID